MRISAYACTHTGRVREKNEDDFFFQGDVFDRSITKKGVVRSLQCEENVQLYAVCDGMGGQADGAKASAAGVSLLSFLLDELRSGADVRASIDRYADTANRAVVSIGTGAGSTLVMLAVRDGVGTVAWLGDSRAYLLRNGTLTRLTGDHTEAERMKKLGFAPSHRSAGNSLTRYLGMDMADLIITPSYCEDIALEKDDAFLLCSDGLTNMLDEDRIGELLARAKSPAKALVEAALEAGGRDNITALVIDVTKASRNAAGNKPRSGKPLSKLARAIGLGAIALALTVAAVLAATGVIFGARDKEPPLEKDAAGVSSGILPESTPDAAPQTPDASETGAPVPEKTPAQTSVEAPAATAAQTPAQTPEQTPAEEKKPLSGIVIGLDPGHQEHSNRGTEPQAPGSDIMKKKVSSGTQGVKSRVEEHVVNLAVGLLLRDMLEEAGATVYMTRTEADVDITNIERAKFFNKHEVDLAVRLHCNGTGDNSVRGAFMLVPADEDYPFYDENIRAAKLILEAYGEETGIKISKGITYRSDQTGFNWCERPIVNIEMGHMSNADEDMLLTDGDFQKKMARGICDGILAYFTQEG